MSFWNSRRFAGWALVFAGILGVAWLARPARVPENVAYVSDERGGITVIDLKTLDILKQIDLKGVEPRGISLTSDGRYLVTANKDTSDASVIDTRSFRTVRRIHIGTNQEIIKLKHRGKWMLTTEE